MLQGADVIGIVVHRLLVAGGLVLDLSAEAFGLVLGIVQLGKAVGDLAPADEELETVGDERVIVVAPAPAATPQSGRR